MSLIDQTHLQTILIIKIENRYGKIYFPSAFKPKHIMLSITYAAFDHALVRRRHESNGKVRILRCGTLYMIYRKPKITQNLHNKFKKKFKRFISTAL